MINTNIYIIWILFYNSLILYSVDVILDPNTAHPRLILSEDRKKVRCGDRHQPIPNNPEHFNCMVCVLGQKVFTHGWHYWEVEVGTKTGWDLGVARHSINRKGKITVNPSKGYWFLSLQNKTNYTFGIVTNKSGKNDAALVITPVLLPVWQIWWLKLYYENNQLMKVPAFSYDGFIYTILLFT